jgi:hypothetical protein
LVRGNVERVVIQSGDFKLSGSERQRPIPTFREMGLPALSMSFWLGLFVPRNTPKEIVSKLRAAAMEALADPIVRSRLTESWAGHFSTRAPDTGGPCSIGESRCREMVADHQGVRDQGRVSFDLAAGGKAP